MAVVEVALNHATVTGAVGHNSAHVTANVVAVTDTGHARVQVPPLNRVVSIVFYRITMVVGAVQKDRRAVVTCNRVKVRRHSFIYLFINEIQSTGILTSIN